MKLTNCPVCGKRIPADAENCPECGFEIRTYLHGSAEKTVASPDVPARSRKRFLIAAAAIVLCAAAGILCCIFVRFSGSAAYDTALLSQDPLPESSSNEAFSQDHTAAPTSPVGVYSGNDNEILVLQENGLACYYCVMPEYIELSCPWSQDTEEHTVSIELAKLHCTITAKLPETGLSASEPSELIFRSESSNWNTEIFTRIDLSPEDYISRRISSNDPAVSVEADGSMTFSVEGITFTIPKWYRDPADDFDTMKNALSFIDNDLQTDYASSILFFSDDCNADSLSRSESDALAAAFAGRFLQTPAVSPAKAQSEIGGLPAFVYEISGLYNTGFQGFSGSSCSGLLTLVFIPQTQRILYVQMLYTDNRGYDPMPEYHQILTEARGI